MMTFGMISEITSRRFIRDVEVLAQPALRRFFHDRQTIIQVTTRPRYAGWMGLHCTCEIFELQNTIRTAEASIADAYQSTFVVPV
jgi:hypothetical protein